MYRSQGYPIGRCRLLRNVSLVDDVAVLVLHSKAEFCQDTLRKAAFDHADHPRLMG